MKHNIYIKLLTFDVFLREDGCVRVPLNTSCIRHPKPHMSVDLYKEITIVYYNQAHAHIETRMHSHHFVIFLPLVSLASSGGLYLLSSRSSLDDGKVSSENSHTNSIPPNFHSPAASTNTDE